MPVYEEKEKVNGQKRYFIRTYVTDEFGKKKQITRHNKNWIGRDGYWEAKQEEIVLQHQTLEKKDDEEIPPDEATNITLDELQNNYILSISKSKLKLSTIKSRKDNYRLYIEPYFGSDKQVNEIKNIDILNWHNWLLEKNFSQRFNRELHLSLVTLINHGCKFYNIEKNVVSIVGNFKKDNKSKKLCFLTSDEFDNFISFENNQIYKNFFIILFNTGMRLGELWCLKWSKINFNSRQLVIDASYNPRNELETTPKTAKSNRTILLTDTAIKSLNDMKKYQNSEYVFGTSKIKGTTLRRKCKNNCKAAGINKNIRIHDFRHSFASMCINKGVPIEILSEYLGHENISTTQNVYIHLYPNSQEKLVATLENKDSESKIENNFENYIIDLVHSLLIEGNSINEIVNRLKNFETRPKTRPKII